MTFHPESLDLAQLKRLSKAMSRRSLEVLPKSPLSLSQSQELIARSLGYANWHDAAKGCKGSAQPSEKSNPESSSAMDTAYRGMDHLRVYERIMMGVFIAAIMSDREQATAALEAMGTAALAGHEGLWLPTTASLDAYSEEIRLGLELSMAYPNHAIAFADKPTTVGQILGRALVLARTFQPIPSVQFHRVLQRDIKLWEFLQSLGRSQSFSDPFRSASVRLQLFEDLLLVMGGGAVSFLDAIDHLAQGYRKHGWEDRAYTLDSIWRPGIEAASRWGEFLSKQLAAYDPRAALRFELLLNPGEANFKDALYQVVVDTQALVAREGRISLYSQDIPV